MLRQLVGFLVRESCLQSCSLPLDLLTMRFGAVFVAVLLASLATTPGTDVPVSSTTKALLSDEEACCRTAELKTRRCLYVCAVMGVIDRRQNFTAACPFAEPHHHIKAAYAKQFHAETAPGGAYYTTGRGGIRCAGIRGRPKSGTTFTMSLVAEVCE